MKTLTLVVTYNEADNIARLVPEILRHLPESHVLVVDDNSPDGTAEVVRQFGKRDPRVGVICRTQERGYGSAMITGMRRAIEDGFETILTLDADFSHDPADLPRLLDAPERVGCHRRLTVCGRRARAELGSAASAAQPWRQRLRAVPERPRLVSTAPAASADIEQAFSKGSHSTRLRTTGYAFLPELLFTLHGARVTEVPICYTERRLGESKMSKRVIAEAIVRPWILLMRRIGRAATGTHQVGSYKAIGG